MAIETRALLPGAYFTLSPQELLDAVHKGAAARVPIEDWYIPLHNFNRRFPHRVYPELTVCEGGVRLALPEPFGVRRESALGHLVLETPKTDGIILEQHPDFAARWYATYTTPSALTPNHEQAFADILDIYASTVAARFSDLQAGNTP